MAPDPLIEELERALRAPGLQLAPAAMVLARLEYPRLDPQPYLRQLAELGTQAAVRLEGLPGTRERIAALNGFLFGTLGFAGDREQFIDPRNSFLNDVLDRRLGIPITLSIVYLEVGRHAGMPLHGVGFPGHFLVRCEHEDGPILIDPFNGGAVLSEFDCVNLLRAHAGEDAPWHPSLLDATDRLSIVLRMLTNLKRAYVALRSFALARRVADLLVALDPEAITELRDRGLLSYHLEEFSPALRDLERYLQLMPRADAGPGGGRSGNDESEEASRKEFEAIWEHVKNLRRRVASFN